MCRHQKTDIGLVSSTGRCISAIAEPADRFPVQDAVYQPKTVREMNEKYRNLTFSKKKKLTKAIFFFIRLEQLKNPEILNLLVFF